MKQIMVVVQLEQLQRTHREPRKYVPPPNHIHGVLARFKYVLTNELSKKVTAKKWKSILLNERLSSWAMWWQMKLVNKHEEGQVNPRGEVALDPKGLRSLLGLANYYSCFVQDFSKVARTLSDLLKKWLSQEWDEPCHQAFGELKSKLSSPPVLKFVDFDKHFEVHTGRVTLPLADCWCKMNGHCIWKHEA